MKKKKVRKKKIISDITEVVLKSFNLFHNFNSGKIDFFDEATCSLYQIGTNKIVPLCIAPLSFALNTPLNFSFKLN